MQGDIKRTAEQRYSLLQLLSTDSLNGFVKAIKKAATSADDDQYVFLKRICQVLVHLGVSQLGPLWVCDEEYIIISITCRHVLKGGSNAFLKFEKGDEFAAHYDGNVWGRNGPSTCTYPLHLSSYICVVVTGRKQICCACIILIQSSS